MLYSLCCFKLSLVKRCLGYVQYVVLCASLNIFYVVSCITYFPEGGFCNSSFFILILI